MLKNKLNWNWSLRNRKLKIYCEFYRLQFCRDFWNISSSSTVLVDHTQFYQFAVMFGFCILTNKINNFETYTYRAISHPVNVILSFWIIVAFIASLLSSASKSLSSCAFELSQVLQIHASVHTSAFSTQIQFSLQARLQLQDTSLRTYKVDKKQEWI